MRPLEAIDQLLQAVILGMSGRNSVLLFGADRFGLALSLMLSSPAMKVHVGASDWPMEATSDLGLLGRISRHDLPWQAVATETVSLPKVDAVLIDCRQSYVPQNNMPQLLKRFARCLNGMDGAFVAIHASRDPDFEAHLKENFLMVYRFEISGGPVVYIGRKYEIPVDSFWCGFSQSMSMTGLEHLSIAYACSATLLRKDGGEVNL